MNALRCSPAARVTRVEVDHETLRRWSRQGLTRSTRLQTSQAGRDAIWVRLTAAIAGLEPSRHAADIRSAVGQRVHSWRARRNGPLADAL